MTVRARVVVAVVSALVAAIVASVVFGMIVGAPTLPAGGAAPAVLVGAGDISSCVSDGDEMTAALLDEIPGTVFTAGDNAYTEGRPEQFAECYDPTWGRHKDRTRPAPGNHDLRYQRGAGYFAYFGEAAGEPGEGYYSYELGAWHVIMLNSECRRVGCEPDPGDDGEEQFEWLAADLEAHPSRCTVAMWHHPRWGSGRYGDDPRTAAIWDLLYEHGVDVIVNGHEHLYERFAPMDPSGEADPERGIRQFIVGTGGGTLRGFEVIHAQSEVRFSVWGVLKLTLHESSYDWEFVPVAGEEETDAGSGECH